MTKPSPDWSRRVCSLGAMTSLALLLSCSTSPFNPISEGERDAGRGAPTISGTGTSAFAVSAADDETRRLFHQGMQLAYAFEYTEAARAFRAGYARDASCAMCAWGVALALGPNINAPDRRNEAEIRRYIARAQQAAVKATPLEQALIQAMAVRYGFAAPELQRQVTARAEAMCSTGEKRDVHPLELAYAQ